MWRIFGVILALSVLPRLGLAAATHWQTVAPGLSYTQINLPLDEGNHGTLYAFEFSPKRYTLSLSRAMDLGRSGSDVVDLAEQANALIAVNGGFFSPASAPLGLRVRQGQLLNAIKPISWWGVFRIEKGKPYISTWQDFKLTKEVSFATQSGPRLLIQGQIPSLKPGNADRSALCITAKGDIVMLATANASLSLYQLASLMRDTPHQGGLGCVDALNLDGGTSTQMYAKVGDIDVNVPNFKSLVDAVVVVPTAS